MPKAHKSAKHADRVPAGILFGDLKGSTAAAEVDELRAVKVLQDYLELIAETVEAFSPRYFKIKAESDGFMARFATAHVMVQCGMALKNQFLKRGWKVRLGGNYVEAFELELEGDLIGADMNRTARIAAAAQPEGCQFLVSEAVAVVIRDRLTGIAFALHGVVEAKGIKEGINTYEVVGRDQTSKSAARRLGERQRQCEWIVTRYARVEVLGTSVVSRLKDVYVPLSTVGAEMGGSTPPTLLLDLVNKDSLCITGAPGSGKSTFCKWVAWLACSGEFPRNTIPAPYGYQEHLTEAITGRLPLLIPLRELWPSFQQADLAGSGTQQISGLIERWLNQGLSRVPLKWTSIADRLSKGEVVLFLDGFDEIPIESKEGVPVRATVLSGLQEAVPQWNSQGNRILVTSRPFGLLASEIAGLGLKSVSISGLGDSMVEVFVRRWYNAGSDDPLAGEQAAEEMLGHLRARDDLSELINNPLFLTALCIIYSREKPLPQDKFFLYHHIVDELLRRRYKTDRTSIGQARKQLTIVALGMHRENPKSPEPDITLEMISRHLERFVAEKPNTDSSWGRAIDARESLLSHSGILIQVSEMKARFYHRSFQEFLAAEGMFREIEDSDDLEREIIERSEIRDWHDTLLFFFGTILTHRQERARSLLARLIDEIGSTRVGLHVVVAGCIQVLRNRHLHLGFENQENRFRKHSLDALARNILVDDRQTIAMALGRIGDPRIVPDLRGPGGYVPIQHGDYKCGPSGRHELNKPLLFSQHLVTNGQFELFIKDGGYERLSEFWSDGGRRWLKEQPCNEPELWSSTKFNSPNQPVVGVSFWECEAFCMWAGGRLPSELEWEAAARGPEGFLYPWGNEWIEGICNTLESGLNQPSPVGLFPESKSKPFGLHDMAGNVFEYCFNYYDPSDAISRVAKGGAWLRPKEDTRADGRFWYSANVRSNYVGFRVVRSLE